MTVSAPLCPVCNVEMKCKNPDMWADEWECPECGTTGNTINGYFVDDDAEDSDDEMPACCAACGCSAYPKCKTSCKLFDD